MEADLVENKFWLGLWQALNQESQRHTDESVPIEEQMVTACERLAQKVQRDGEFYLMAGAENVEPVPSETGINMLIFGTIFGNYLAWRSGIKFFDRVKPNQ
jgi:hypothetical protein